MNFLVWIFLVYGINLIVTYSKLLDGFRNWYWEIDNLNYFLDGVPPEHRNQNKLTTFVFQLIGCWLCTAFWTGLFLTWIHIGPYNCGFANGAVAVGVVGIIELILGKQND
jgi:hypothetical protein